MDRLLSHMRDSASAIPARAALTAALCITGLSSSAPEAMEQTCDVPSAEAFQAVDAAIGNDTNPQLRDYEYHEEAPNAAGQARARFAASLGLRMHEYKQVDEENTDFSTALAGLQRFASQYGVTVTVAHGPDESTPTAKDLASPTAVRAINYAGSYLSKLPEQTVNRLGVNEIEFIATKPDDPEEAKKDKDGAFAKADMDGSGKMYESVDEPNTSAEHETGHLEDSETCGDDFSIAANDQQFRDAQGSDAFEHDKWGSHKAGVDSLDSAQFRSEQDMRSSAKSRAMGYYKPAADLAARCEMASLAKQVEATSSYDGYLTERKAELFKAMLSPQTNNNAYVFDPAFPRLNQASRLIAARMFQKDPAFTTYILRTVERPENCGEDLQTRMSEAAEAAKLPDRNCKVTSVPATSIGRQRLAQSSPSSTIISCEKPKPVSAFAKAPAPVTP